MLELGLIPRLEVQQQFKLRLALICIVCGQEARPLIFAIGYSSPGEFVRAALDLDLCPGCASHASGRDKWKLLDKYRKLRASHIERMVLPVTINVCPPGSAGGALPYDWR